MKTRILFCMLIIISCVAFSGTWEDITNPDLPITVSNKFEKNIQLLGRTIRTNEVVDLGSEFSRERINANMKAIYDAYTSGKISITNSGNIPVKNF
jgi:hypothetical protein